MKVFHRYYSANGLRTPNEGIHQRNLKIWAAVADKICFGPLDLKIWEWELIFGRAVKTISSSGILSPFLKALLLKIKAKKLSYHAGCLVLKSSLVLL